MSPSANVVTIENITERPAVKTCSFLGFMVLNAIFNNILVISWWSVLMMEETGEPGENHQPVTSH